MSLECELKLTRRVIRIGLRNASERGVAKACPAASVSDIKVWRVGEIEALRSELHLQAFRDWKVLENGEIDVTELGSKQRIALSVPYGSERLRSKRSGIEELRIGLVAETGILDLVRAVLPAVVERGGAIVIAVLFAVTFDWVIRAAPGFGNRKRLAALPGHD